MRSRALACVAIASSSLTAWGDVAPQAGAETRPGSRRAIVVPQTLRREGAPAEDPLELPDLDVRAHAVARIVYTRFVESQDLESFARDYPKIVADLSGTSQVRQIALRMCRASEDPRCIPWVVDALTSPDPYVRAWAGAAIQDLVSDIELRRRDSTRPEDVYLRPRKTGDPELRALRWVVVEMARSGDSALSSVAATMAGYLGLADLAPTLEVLQRSRHPAVANAATHALGQLQRDR